jgi:hypothetical protein
MNMRVMLLLLALLAVLVSTTAAVAQDQPSTPEDPAAPAAPPTPTPTPPSTPMPVFDATFEVTLVPSEKSAHVEIQLGSGSEAVEWLRFDIDPNRYRSIEADGELGEVEGRLEWRPPAGGGSFRYIFSIDHLRDEGAYDSRCTKSWAIFRGQDLVPRVRIRTDPIARSRSNMRLILPEGWSAAVPYPRFRGGRYSLKDSRSRFDRPSGWFAFGQLGVVRESMGDTQISIAGPARQGARRMDLLALMKWTLPALADVFGELPSRLNVVVAGDPMWRGGLSGPRSVFLHSDRPLIDPDATSPILHELMHSLMHARSGEDGNWIVEGLAEFYSIALLHRTKTISDSRYESRVEQFRSRGSAPSATLKGRINGTNSRAKAVVAMIEIDEAIRSATEGANSLDEVVRILTEADEPVTTQGFRAAAEGVAGRELSAVFERVGP